MRVIAGKTKYKKLYFKRNQLLRPTRSIVRKSFFDTMMGLIEDSVFLDLFAGCGSIGTEALSRGAKKVVFVDKSKESISLIKKNVKGFENAEVIKSDAVDFLDNPILKEITVAYVDPPYDYEINQFLFKLFDVINPEAVVCVEHDKKTNLFDSFGEFRKFKSRTFGKNMLDYFGVGYE